MAAFSAPCFPRLISFVVAFQSGGIVLVILCIPDGRMTNSMPLGLVWFGLVWFSVVTVTWVRLAVAAISAPWVAKLVVVLHCVSLGLGLRRGCFQRPLGCKTGGCFALRKPWVRLTPWLLSAPLIPHFS